MTRLAMLLCLLACPLAAAEDQKKKPPITVGKPAPNFKLPNQLGKPVELAAFKKGKAPRWVLLAFYPKSGTPG